MIAKLAAPFFPWVRELKETQRKAMFSAWLGYVFDGFDFMLIFYIVHLIKPDLGLTNYEATFLATAAFIGRPIGGAFFGLMADKFGRKPMMMWSIVAYSVGTGLSSIAPGFVILSICRFIVGIGMAGEYACSSTYAVESWPKHLKSKASAILVSGFGIGNILAAYFMPQFAETYGWRLAFLVGLLPVLLVFYIRSKAPESVEWEDAQKNNGDKSSLRISRIVGDSLRGLFNWAQLPLTLCIFIVLFAIFGANWPIFGLLPSFLTSEGFDISMVSNLMTAAAFGTVCGNILWGMIADKIGLKKTFIIGLSASIPFILALFQIPNDNYYLLAACLFFLMFTNIGVGGLVPKFLYEYFPIEVRGLGSGLIYNLAATSGMFNSMAATFIGLHVGVGQALTFVVGFWSLTIIIIIGLGIPDLLKIRRDKKIVKLNKVKA